MSLSWHDVKSTVQRVRGRTFGELSRSVGLRIWPLSVLTKSYYRLLFWDPIWERLVNRVPVTEFAKGRSTLDPFQIKVVEDLRRDGICILNIEELLQDSTLLASLAEEKNVLLRRPDIDAQIREQRSRVGGKSYVIRAFKADPVLDLSSAIGQLCVNEKILAIVNHYFEMYCRLKSFDLWYNLPVQNGSEPEVGSQKWHRDYDDRRLLKLFLYLDDVDATMGPFTYLRETQTRGRLKHVFPSHPPQGSYPPAGAVERSVPDSQRVSCTGKAGTLILCDTTGFHKGGRSTTRPRVLITATYASNAALDRDNYRLTEVDRRESLSRAAKFAIRASDT